MTSPGGRAFSPLWLLLLLPIGGGIGWLVAAVPVPAAKPQSQYSAVRPDARASDAPAPATGTETAPVATPSRTGTDAPVAVAETSPRPAERKPDVVAVGAIHWMDLSDAMAESQRTGKPVFIDFSADWCGPCQRLRQAVFEDPTHARAVEDAVLPVSIVDRSKENGSNTPEVQGLQQRFGVNAFPTLVIFTPSSTKFVRTQGFADADEAVSWIVQGAQVVK